MIHWVQLFWKRSKTGEFTRAEKKDGRKAGALAEAEEHMWYKLLE